MAVKLHRCSVMWAKIGGHPCWKVQKSLDEAGVEYELIKHPAFPKSRRTAYIELSGGQNTLPAIELEDGTVVREESKDLIARINEGWLSAPAETS